MQETYGSSAIAGTTDLIGYLDLGGNSGTYKTGFAASGVGGGVNWDRPQATGRVSWNIQTSGNRSVLTGANGWGADVATGLNLNFNHGHDYNHAHNMDSSGGSEARPANYTVRMWKRIA